MPQAAQLISVTDEFYDPGKRGPLHQGWAWYVGI